MAVRTITDTIRRPDGSAWAGAEVLFILRPGTYETGGSYPKATVTGLTNGSGALKASDGTAALSLWCNDAALTPAHYLCQLPDGDQFPFDLVEGDGSPVSLAILRALGVTIMPTDPIYAVVAEMIADAIADSATDFQLTSEKNQPDGYAGLDGSGLIPDNRIPASIARDTEITTALTAYAPLASPALTGTPTSPTAVPGTNTTQIATTAFVQAMRDALVNSAPGLLDTLDELAAALGDDANFAATVTTALAGKATPADIATAVDLGERIAINFTNNGDAYIPADEAMTLDLMAASSIGTGTLAYAKSTAATPSVFNSTTLPATLEAGAYLKVTLTGTTTFRAVGLKRTA